MNHANQQGVQAAAQVYTQAVEQYAVKLAPRSIPVYEAKNRIDAANDAVGQAAAALANVISDLENRLSSVLVPVPPMPAEKESSVGQIGGVRGTLQSVAPAQAPLTDALHSTAASAESSARYLDTLRMRINALIDRVEA